MKHFWERLKKRWGIEKDWQVAVILLVFTLTGFTTLYVDRLIDEMLGIGEESPFVYKVLVFLIIVLPVYNLLLFVYGSLLGQHRFFKNFILQFFKRIFCFRQKK